MPALIMSLTFMALNGFSLRHAEKPEYILRIVFDERLSIIDILLSFLFRR